MARVGRQRFAMAVAVAAIAVVPAFGTADASAASCGSSTAASRSYTDPAGDAGTQPDITNTALALDTACDIDVTFSVANRPVGLAGDDHLYLQLDTDGDTTT